MQSKLLVRRPCAVETCMVNTECIRSYRKLNDGVLNDAWPGFGSTRGERAHGRGVAPLRSNAITGNKRSQREL